MRFESPTTPPPPCRARPRLTAIVPATDRPPTLPACLAAIREADEPPEELLAVEKPAGAGPAAARNAAARRAAGDVLVFVDSDVVVHRDAFARIRRALEANSELTAVFGAYDDDPPAPGAVSGFRNLLHHHVHTAGAGPAHTFWAGLGAVRRDAFLASGGFNEARYPEPSIEDVELGGRLVRRGARIELDPSIRGTHLKAWTLPQMVATDFSRRGVPWVELIAEGGAANGLNLGWRHRLSAGAALAAVGFASARRPGGAFAAALTLVALNPRFYRLVLERRGPVQGVAAVGLHAVHHLTSVLAVPVGLARVARRRLPYHRAA